MIDKEKLLDFCQGTIKAAEKATVKQADRLKIDGYSRGWYAGYLEALRQIEGKISEGDVW